jgi:adenosylmethionine-8-amino-7-oxononanoate aminotransferase
VTNRPARDRKRIPEVAAGEANGQEEAWMAADAAFLWHPFTRQKSWDPAHMLVRGEGAWVTDVRGRRLLDGFSGLWSVNLGYARRDITDAIKAQLDVLPSASLFGLSHPLAALLAERIAGCAPGDLRRVFFSVQGSQAVETSLKLARLYWRTRGYDQKTIIVTRDRAYHGTSYGALSVQGIPGNRVPFAPLLPDVRRIAAPYSYRCRYCRDTCTLECADELDVVIQREGADRVACMIAEPVMGSGGVLVPPPEYFARLREICDRHDVLLIADEVMTGFGRTGWLFGVGRSDVTPDMLLLGKGMTAGYMPMAATVVREHIYQEVIERDTPGPEFATGNTWDAHPPSCAAALATLDALDRDGIVERVGTLAPTLEHELRGVAGTAGVGEVRTIGLLAGIELVRDTESREQYEPGQRAASIFAEECWSRTLIVRPLAGDVVAIAPPFIVDTDDLTFLGEVLVDAADATRARLA